MPRILIVAGLLVALLGVLMHLGLPLGRLPGDIVVKRENSTFYFPIVTCLLISVVLSIAAMLLRR
jgi:hypothetical protein